MSSTPFIPAVSDEDTPRWSPRITLCLDSEILRCPGFAASTRQRCRNPIGKERRKTIHQIIRTMEFKDPNPDLLLLELGDLAFEQLCHCHKDQVEGLREKWEARILSQYPAEPPEPVQSAEPVEPAERVHPVEPSVDEVQALGDGVLAQDRQLSTVRSETFELARSVSNSSPTLQTHHHMPPTRVQTDDISSLDIGPASLPSDSDTRRAEDRSIEPFTGSDSEGAHTTERVSRSNDSPMPVWRRCRGSHVQRRNYNDNCPICYETMGISGIRALVWCKRQCGQSVHRQCFRIWEDSQLAQELAVTCVNCRADWDDPCEHDLNLPSAHG